MAIICPKCGREFLGQRDTCPVCGCATVDDSGIDNSEAARKQRLQKLQEQKLARAMEQARQPQVREEQLRTEPVQPSRTTQNGVSGVGIVSVWLPDLCRNDIGDSGFMYKGWKEKSMLHNSVDNYMSMVFVYSTDNFDWF